MSTQTPGPSSTPLAPSRQLTAHESREKRIARQQARYRDRGGVFVPQQRTNLLDILLGKTTLKQVSGRRSKSRSRSLSPVRRKSRRDIGVDEEPTPSRKKGRKSAAQSTPDEQANAVAGSSKVKKAPPVRNVRKKADDDKATRRKVGAASDSDDIPLKPPTVLSNSRVSTKSATLAALNADSDIDEVSRPRRTSSRKTKATSTASKAKRGGKAKLTMPEEEDIALDNEGKPMKGIGKTKPARTKVSDTQLEPNEVIAPPKSERSTHKDSPSDVTKDNDNGPNLAPVRRGKRRNATDHVAEGLGEGSQKPSRAKSTKSKTTTNRSKKTKSSKKQSGPPDGGLEETAPEHLASKRGARSALTPVPEESEPPESDEEREESAARSAHELAAVISKAIEDFAPVSKDVVVVNEPKGKGKDAAVVSRGKRKRQLVGDEDTVSSPAKFPPKLKGKGNRSAADQGDEDDSPLLTPKQKGGKAGKGKERTKAPVSQAESEGNDLILVEPLDMAAALHQSTPRSQKRARPAVDEAPSTPPAKKVKTGRVKVTKEKGSAKSKRPRDTDEAEDEGGHRSALQKKRKRIAEVEEEEVEEPTAESPPKKKKTVSASLKPIVEKISIASPKQLKIASRKHKENATASTSSTSSRTAAPTTQPSALVKKTTKPRAKKPPSRGPPQSVLDRIKESASTHLVDDEPDELDFLS
ncbi:hypothetical protein BDP27DRAFT_1309362 [Rhodocollybia butyracea]|uniref:Uncharacterized protein n=1 Tax=Rhodocollybia butyracea TaxID=206335 RepID=A0A9P5QAM3_9AGAR|nr:hypothetical protein BDP27DRAFT_1309362 [Rhodocollybia butyracea]